MISKFALILLIFNNSCILIQSISNLHFYSMCLSYILLVLAYFVGVIIHCVGFFMNSVGLIFTFYWSFVCLCYTALSVTCSLVITCLEWADLLTLLCVCVCFSVTFPNDVAGQV